MQFSIEDKFYGIFCVNFLPGFLLGGELAIVYEIYFGGLFKTFYDFYFNNNGSSLPITILLIFLVFIISSLLGLIIDFTHHFFYRDIESRIKTIYKINEDKDLNIYKFRTVALWYSYETCTNIAFSLIIGLLIAIPLLINKLNIVFFIIWYVFSIISVIMLITSKRHIELIQKCEKALYDNQKENKH